MHICMVICIQYTVYNIIHIYRKLNNTNKTRANLFCRIIYSLMFTISKEPFNNKAN